MHGCTEIEDHKDTTGRTRCTHDKSNGGRCGSPALRGGNLCYFHSEHRGSVEQIRERKARHRSITLSSIRTREEIQRAIEAVMQAIAAAEIDSRRAGLLLYSLQLASSNINQHQNNHFKALPKPMQYLGDNPQERIAQEKRRESHSHYGTEEHPQFAADGGPISQTPGYVSVERKHNDEAIPDFTGRPGQWEKLDNGIGSLLLESLGKHYSNNRPLSAKPSERCTAPEPQTIVIAAVQATATTRTHRRIRMPHLRRATAKVGIRAKLEPLCGCPIHSTRPYLGCPIHDAVLSRHDWIIRAVREPLLGTPGLQACLSHNRGGAVFHSAKAGAKS
ncbi:MAG: hypothetical protein JSS95_03785 [Acidobacteria bacterium]|nr:hypothetical protein [Acidobacteriota bacterium]